LFRRGVASQTKQGLLRVKPKTNPPTGAREPRNSTELISCD
jgi:hypothetical protein